MQRHFWVALLLQVGNDGLADQLGIANHMENLEGWQNQQLEAKKTLPEQILQRF